MKKTLYVIIGIAGVGGVALLYGAPDTRIVGVTEALEGPEAVGIIVKNGTKMDQVLASFTVNSVPCDSTSTTTPQVMCPEVLFEGRPVNVYYTADNNMVGKQSFMNRLGSFPFAGRIEYVNRAQADIEPRLIQYMTESGAGSYTIIYEP